MAAAVTYSWQAGLRGSVKWTYAMTISWLLAGAAYEIGFGQMRYAAIPPKEVVSDWPFWQFFIAGFYPNVVYAFGMLLLLTAAFTKRKPSRFLTYGTIFVALTSVAWNVIFVIWQATVWSRCNDGAGTLIPAHPECVNRNYPLKQSADWTFIIQVIAAGVLCLPSLIAFYIAQQVVNTALGAGTYVYRGGVEVNETGVDLEGYAGGDLEDFRGTHLSRRHAKGSSALQPLTSRASSIGQQLSSE